MCNLKKLPHSKWDRKLRVFVETAGPPGMSIRVYIPAVFLFGEMP
jgi:hypothetical protein